MVAAIALVVLALGAWLALRSTPSSMSATARWLEAGAPGPAYQQRLSSDLHRFDADFSRSTVAFAEHPSATRLAHAIVGALVDCAMTQSALESHPPLDPPSQPLRGEWIAWRRSVARFDASCANLSSDPARLGAKVTELTALYDLARRDGQVLRGTTDPVVEPRGTAD